MKHLLLVSAVATLVPLYAGAQARQAGKPSHDVSAAAKIRNAMAAAPASVSAAATIMDWPAGEGAPLVKLRDGTNGFTCLPHMPTMEGNAPMCLDSVWMQFIDAVGGHKPFKADRVGIGYMIAPGGTSGSNTDPFAHQATPDNEWGFDPPHTMFLVPDLSSLAGIPTKRQAGGPWVMYPGTPFAHIMVPVLDVKK